MYTTSGSIECSLRHSETVDTTDSVELLNWMCTLPWGNIVHTADSIECMLTIIVDPHLLNWTELCAVWAIIWQSTNWRSTCLEWLELPINPSLICHHSRIYNVWLESEPCWWGWWPWSRMIADHAPIIGTLGFAIGVRSIDCMIVRVNTASATRAV